MSAKPNSAIETAAFRLREMALAQPEGALLGREEGLVETLGVSRATVRQAARLLEREGMLRVRRGIAGGYFAGRPDLGVVEAAVSGYLDTLDMDIEDVTVVASVLWVEAMRKAASLGDADARQVAQSLRERVEALEPDAPFVEVLELERASRTEVFALTKTRYIELIFQINVAFAGTRFPPVSRSQGSRADREFMEAWRRAKLLELDAIRDADPELGMLAARRGRELWHQRIWPKGSSRRTPASRLPEAAAGQE